MPDKDITTIKVGRDPQGTSPPVTLRGQGGFMPLLKVHRLLRGRYTTATPEKDVQYKSGIGPNEVRVKYVSNDHASSTPVSTST